MKVVFLFFLCVLVMKTYAQIPRSDKLPPQTGNITFDPKIDNPSFHPCDTGGDILQYYGLNTNYKGRVRAIKKYFGANFKYQPAYAGVTGYITIRFIVNCKGQTGWFRIKQIDKDYQPAQFNEKIVTKLLKLTKMLNGWVPGKWNGQYLDTYYYLNFKLIDGHLKDITP